MELRLWRLLAVVAAVLVAAGHLAATRGMGAIVLIGLCVRHMTAFKNLSNARRVARVDYRQRVSAWPTKNSTPSAHRATFESFEGASELSIESATGSILQYRVR
jgi:hypothetical protein